MAGEAPEEPSSRVIAGSGGLARPAFERLEPADPFTVDEYLRNRRFARDRTDNPAPLRVRQRHFGVIVAELAQKRFRLRAEAAAFARENRDLVGLRCSRVHVIEHRVGIGYLERVAGLLGLDEHPSDDAVPHEHRVAPRALAETQV